uniref:Phosphotransferase n=1 Tax=Steinernema glaseri TaxID=37863 RepID=A0A1I7YMP2_9BILA
MSEIERDFIAEDDKDFTKTMTILEEIGIESVNLTDCANVAYVCSVVSIRVVLKKPPTLPDRPKPLCRRPTGNDDKTWRWSARGQWGEETPTTTHSSEVKEDRDGVMMVNSGNDDEEPITMANMALELSSQTEKLYKDWDKEGNEEDSR